MKKKWIVILIFSLLLITFVRSDKYMKNFTLEEVVGEPYYDEEIVRINDIYVKNLPIYANAGTSFIGKVKEPDKNTIQLYMYIDFPGVLDKQRLSEISKDIYIGMGKELFDLYENKKRITIAYVIKDEKLDRYGNSEIRNLVLSKYMLRQKTALKINWDNLRNSTIIDDSIFDKIYIHPDLDEYTFS